MHEWVAFVESLQSYLDLEESWFLGIRADQWAHFAISFLWTYLALKFKRPVLGVVLLIVLMVLKEINDLGMILYYEPLRSEFWLDTFYDLLSGLAGIFIGSLIYGKTQ